MGCWFGGFCVGLCCWVLAVWCSVGVGLLVCCCVCLFVCLSLCGVIALLSGWSADDLILFSPLMCSCWPDPEGIA